MGAPSTGRPPPNPSLPSPTITSIQAPPTRKRPPQRASGAGKIRAGKPSNSPHTPFKPPPPPPPLLYGKIPIYPHRSLKVNGRASWAAPLPPLAVPHGLVVGITLHRPFRLLKQKRTK